MSAATLSRVERDKQAIDVELFLVLARVLSTTPADLLNDGTEDTDAALATRIAGMQSGERTQFWRALNIERRGQRLHKRADNVTLEVEELLAQMDFLREEIESIRERLAKKR